MVHLANDRNTTSLIGIQRVAAALDCAYLLRFGRPTQHQFDSRRRPNFNATRSKKDDSRDFSVPTGALRRACPYSFYFAAGFVHRAGTEARYWLAVPSETQSQSHAIMIVKR
jgi:hypothetical protein